MRTLHTPDALALIEHTVRKPVKWDPRLKPFLQHRNPMVRAVACWLTRPEYGPNKGLIAHCRRPWYLPR